MSAATTSAGPGGDPAVTTDAGLPGREHQAGGPAEHLNARAIEERAIAALYQDLGLTTERPLTDVISDLTGEALA